MVTTFKNHVHADIKKNPQYVKMGDALTTPTVFTGALLANPNFLGLDVDGARLVATTAYETVDRRKAGTMGRIDQTIHKERYTATLTFNASNGNANFQEWCINESLITDNDTPSNPITFMQSYEIAGTETFEQLLACLPTRCDITIGSTGHIVYTITLSCRQRIEDTSGPTIGTGSYATELTQAPWIASDGGVDHFDWDGVAEALDSFSLSIDRQYGISSPTESIKDMYRQETIRNHSGNMAIITRTSDIITDAFAIPRVPKAMNIVLKAGTGGITIAIGNAIIENPSGRNPDPASSEVWMDDYSWGAETVVATTNA